MIAESLPVTAVKSAIKSSAFNQTKDHLPLPLILLVQSVSSLVALRNTAFQDEALYLLAGRQIFLNWLGKTPYVEPYGLYFSGYPSFYPVISPSKSPKICPPARTTILSPESPSTIRMAPATSGCGAGIPV